MRQEITLIPILLLTVVFAGCFKVQLPVKEVADVTKDAYTAAKNKLGKKQEKNESSGLSINNKEFLKMVREILPQDSKTAQSIDREDPVDIIARFAAHEGFVLLSHELGKRQREQP